MNPYIPIPGAGCNFEEHMGELGALLYSSRLFIPWSLPIKTGGLCGREAEVRPVTGLAAGERGGCSGANAVLYIKATCPCTLEFRKGKS